MAWLAVDKKGSEYCFNDRPFNFMYGKRVDVWLCQDEHGIDLGEVELPKGSIKKLIGIELTWEDWRLANGEEKQRLFDVLAKEGKQWNPDKKCVEPLEWKPKDKELVWFWDDDIISRRYVGFYDAKYNRVFSSDCRRGGGGGSWDNYAPYEGEYPDWAKEALKKLED